MKRNVAMLLAAGAAALGAPGTVIVPSSQAVVGPQGSQGGATGQAMQRGNLASALAGVISGGGSYGYDRGHVYKRFRLTMAHQKRASRKRRNRLRAKGQHRKAVR